MSNTETKLRQELEEVWMLLRAERAAAAAAQLSANPVAWRVRYKRAPDYWIIFQHYPTDAMQDPDREVFPLYSGAEPIGVSAI